MPIADSCSPLRLAWRCLLHDVRPVFLVGVGCVVCCDVCRDVCRLLFDCRVDCCVPAVRLLRAACRSL
eukprot:5149114-Lingulodinium_polyedra.AAC.1